MLNQDLKLIYDKYRSELRPLIAEYESRNELFVTPLLHELPAMFDNIALYCLNPKDSDMEKYKESADACLDTVIGDLKRCIVASMMVHIKQFKSLFSKQILHAIDGGRFYIKFIKLETEARKDESVNKETAYLKLKEMELMIENCHASKIIISLSHNKLLNIIEPIVAIVFALIIDYLVYKYL